MASAGPGPFQRLHEILKGHGMQTYSMEEIEDWDPTVKHFDLNKASKREFVESLNWEEASGKWEDMDWLLWQVHRVCALQEKLHVERCQREERLYEMEREHEEGLDALEREVEEWEKELGKQELDLALCDTLLSRGPAEEKSEEGGAEERPVAAWGCEELESEAAPAPPVLAEPLAASPALPCAESPGPEVAGLSTASLLAYRHLQPEEPPAVFPVALPTSASPPPVLTSGEPPADLSTASLPADRHLQAEEEPLPPADIPAALPTWSSSPPVLPAGERPAQELAADEPPLPMEPVEPAPASVSTEALPTSRPPPPAVPVGGCAAPLLAAPVQTVVAPRWQQPRTLGGAAGRPPAPAVPTALPPTTALPPNTAAAPWIPEETPERLQQHLVVPGAWGAAPGVAASAAAMESGLVRQIEVVTDDSEEEENPWKDMS